MLITAAYCLGRIVVATTWRRTTHFDVDVGHVAMGVAMAGMLVASLQTLPAGAWEVIFAGLSVWFAVQIVRFVSRWGIRGWDDDHLHHASHYVTHLAMVLAMLYMFADPAMARMTLGGDDMTVMGSGPPGATASGLPLLLAFILLVAAVWYADGLTRFVGGGRLAGGRQYRAAPPANGDRADAEAAVLAAMPLGAGGSTQTEQAVRRRVVLGGGEVLSCSDRRWLAPRLEIATHIAMCVTMSYVLVLLR